MGPAPWDHGTGPMGPWDRARWTMGPVPWHHGTGPVGPWDRAHGTATMGPGPWDRAHGTGTMGPGPCDRAHGTGTLGPWDRDLGTGPMGPWDRDYIGLNGTMTHGTVGPGLYIYRNLYKIYPKYIEHIPRYLKIQNKYMQTCLLVFLQ